MCVCLVVLSVCYSVFTLGCAQFHGCPSPASSMLGSRTTCRMASACLMREMRDGIAWAAEVDIAIQ